MGCTGLACTAGSGSEAMSMHIQQSWGVLDWLGQPGLGVRLCLCIYSSHGVYWTGLDSLVWE